MHLSRRGSGRRDLGPALRLPLPTRPHWNSRSEGSASRPGRRPPPGAQPAAERRPSLSAVVGAAHAERTVDGQALLVGAGAADGAIKAVHRIGSTPPSPRVILLRVPIFTAKTKEVTMKIKSGLRAGQIGGNGYSGG